MCPREDIDCQCSKMQEVKTGLESELESKLQKVTSGLESKLAALEEKLDVVLKKLGETKNEE